MQYDWYWAKGLYDAEIVDIKKEEYVYDYRQKDPIRNMLEIVLDTRQAMNDSSIKSIRFYNYKIIAGGEDILHAWWYKDEITEFSGRKILKLKLRHSKNKFSETVIAFNTVDVIR